MTFVLDSGIGNSLSVTKKFNSAPELNWTAISSALVTFVYSFCFRWLYQHLVNKLDSSKFLMPFSLLDVFLSIYLFHFHLIWLWVARQTAEITYLELSRALVGLWLPSHCEEALIALFGMRPVSIPSAWKHIRNMASSGKKETPVLTICTNDSHKPQAI